MLGLDTGFNIKSISLLSILQRCGVSLKKAGGYYICSCPLHIDTTPSFVVYVHSNTWTCFGKCQGKNGRHNGGNHIEFVKQYFHYSYKEAIEWLKQNFQYFEPVVVEQKEPEPTKFVPHPWVLYWHSLLGEHRQYFRDRGFEDKFIDNELWGWNGKRYCLPVWEGEPSNSEILGVRQRKVDGQEGMKYLGLKDRNQPTVWGRWYCRQQKIILAFAGEFDAAKAVQDGFPAFSLVNGVNALEDFPKNWPALWFPDSKNMIAVFDRKEEPFGGRLCQAWNRIKGSMTARIFQWPLGDFKDYCEFRQTNSAEDFRHLMLKQGLSCL